MADVREAKPGDMNWLLEQLREFSRFFGSKRSLFPDEGYARVQLERLICEQLFLISQNDYGNQTGFIAGAMGRHWFNPEIRTMTELFWWVKPEHRHSSAGLRLLDALVDYGNRNADWVNFGLEKDSPVADRTLEHRGFRLKERSFLKEVG